jgi:sugar/nucleoside kinase (ribokinase family)
VASRIVCVGEVMLDVLAAEPPPGVRHGPVVVRAGGTPVTAALAAGARGARAVVVGRVGRDPSAAAIRAALADAGVEAVLAVDDERQTGAYVEVGATVVAARGASANLGPEDVPPLAADAVLVSGYTLAHDDTRAAGERALALDARWRGVTAVPLGPFAVPASANVLFATEDEAASFETDAFEVVVVTRGAEGAYVLRGGRTEYLPPTGIGGTGAGDALAGAFLATV